MVRGENLQGLRLLTERYTQSITCTCIDPPYNTGNDGFIYRDGFGRSSWLTMLEDRIVTCVRLFHEDSVIFVSIDDHEIHALRYLMDGVLGPENFVTTVIWQKVYAPKSSAKHFSEDHDYAVAYARKAESWRPAPLPRTSEQDAHYKNPDGDPRGPWRADGMSARNYYSKGTYRITNPNGRVISAPPSGRYWIYSEDKFRELDADGRIWWGENGDNQPAVKRFRSEVRDGRVPQTLWKYEDVGHTQEAKKELLECVTFESSAGVFETPKPTRLIKQMARIAARDNNVNCILDFFAGSGTTGHAVLNLNREDQGRRTFILVEVNDYFDTVLVPRILKATYSKDWKEGKPVDRTPVPGGAIYKVLYLESYEDTLANVTLPARRDDSVLPLRFRREYTVRYMLDHETRAAVLDLDRFRRPFSWTMEVRRGGMVTPEHPVDMVETFNYLIGLRVSRYGFFGDPDRLRYVEGTVLEDGDERRVLVLWRDCDAVPDAEVLRLFDDREFAPVSSREYDRIYVNGDPPLANVRRDGEHWKVLAIEDEFKRLSFADDDGN
ncbi:MAG: site-specific DNA-methyltransferase [Planctomycetes bacterium]|nr:site-specific DNA-methyltransferase [Planctomycetota bacterium]